MVEDRPRRKCAGPTQIVPKMNDATKQRAAVERALMDRARTQAARAREPSPRRYLQHTVALALALILVAFVMLGFDRFLTSLQKYMEVEITERAPGAASQTDAPAPAIPAYVVPAEVSPPPSADPDPRPSPAQAPDNASATPR